LRRWGGGGLVVAGVLACWTSSSTGFVIGGLLFGAAGLLALLGRSGSWATGRFLHALTNASLVLVGFATIVYGLR
jgi:hypothetical protein